MKAGIPTEYLKKKIGFLNCKIDLSKKTFIPRIETEYWVRKAIKEIKKELKDKNKKIKVLDVFAGSGCIGIAILKSIENSLVDFNDIDKRAIAQIKTNLKLNEISSKRYRVYKSSFFERLKGKRYDFIFANPPYIAKQRVKEVESSVLKYEPEIALFSGKKGIYHIKRFLKEAKNFLKKNGIIYLEFDPDQKEEIKHILKKNKYPYFRFFKDQFRKYRWVKIIYKIQKTW